MADPAPRALVHMMKQHIRRAGCAALVWAGAMAFAADLPMPTPPARPVLTAAPAAEPAQTDAEPAAEPAAAEDVAEAPDAVKPVAPVGDPGNPYEAIIIRNSFELRDPPPAPPPAQEPPPTVNPRALKLTGITTLLGKRAMFVFNDGKTNKVSDLVREGERDRVITDLEVLAIDATARTVRVVFGGREMTMDFVKDGLMPPTNQSQVVVAGAGLGRPGTQVAMANTGPRQPIGVTQPAVHVVNTSGPGGVRSLPVRPSRLASGTMTPTTPGNVMMSGGGGGGGEFPAMPVLSPDQQSQLIREQVNYGQQINLPLPPVPPAPGLEDISGPPALPGQPMPQ